MALIIFTLDSDTFTFSVNRTFPVYDPVEVGVPTAKSEGGQIYAYNKGIKAKQHNLAFAGASPDDNTNLEGWIENICVGPTNEFTYTDESSVEHTVRCMNTRNPFQEVANQSFNGTINLIEEL